ncbi:unnamed protein product, partial [Chrysoparadoxa australica]
TSWGCGYPTAKVESISGGTTGTVQGLERFCFPSGGFIELVDAEKVQECVGSHLDTTHLLQFTDISNAPSYGICLTTTEQLNDPSPELVLHLVRDGAARVLQRFLQLCRLCSRLRRKAQAKTGLSLPTEDQLKGPGFLGSMVNFLTTPAKAPAKAPVMGWGDDLTLRGMGGLFTPSRPVGLPFDRATPAAHAVFEARSVLHFSDAESDFNSSLSTEGLQTPLTPPACPTTIQRSRRRSLGGGRCSLAGRLDFTPAPAGSTRGAKGVSPLTKGWAVITKRCYVLVSCHAHHSLMLEVIQRIADSERGKLFAQTSTSRYLGQPVWQQNELKSLRRGDGVSPAVECTSVRQKEADERREDLVKLLEYVSELPLELVGRQEHSVTLHFAPYFKEQTMVTNS